MSAKINVRIITENHAADLELGFLTKSILKPFGRAVRVREGYKNQNVFSFKSPFYIR